MKTLKLLTGLTLLTCFFAFTGCSDDDVPPAENEEEVIDEVTLTFTAGGGAEESFVASGSGGVNFVTPTIILAANTTYNLDITLMNVEEGENITTEVREEGAEHMFFFAWTDGLFSDPSGDGNFDSRVDDVNYNDEDENGLHIGLSTTWTTGAAGSGTFRPVLKHQPDIKSETTTASDGDTDLDLSWDVVIQE